VGHDARLPTQNTKFRVGKLKSKGGQIKKNGPFAAIPILLTLFRKRAGAPELGYWYNPFQKNSRTTELFTPHFSFHLQILVVQYKSHFSAQSFQKSL